MSPQVLTVPQFGPAQCADLHGLCLPFTQAPPGPLGRIVALVLTYVEFAYKSSRPSTFFLGAPN